MSERRDDADRHVALRLLRLLGVGGDRVEADVGEEDERGARQHADRLAAGVGVAEEGLAEEADAGQAVGRERVPVPRVDVEGADDDDEQHGRHLDHHHGGVEAGALADAVDEDDRAARRRSTTAGRLTNEPVATRRPSCGS